MLLDDKLATSSLLVDIELMLIFIFYFFLFRFSEVNWIVRACVIAF